MMKNIILLICILLSACINGQPLHIDFDQGNALVLQRYTSPDGDVVLRRTKAGALQIKLYGDLRIIPLPASTQSAFLSAVVDLGNDSTLMLIDTPAPTVCGRKRSIILDTKKDVQTMEDNTCRAMQYGEVPGHPGTVVYHANYPEKGIPAWVVENGHLYSTLDDRVPAHSANKSVSRKKYSSRHRRNSRLAEHQETPPLSTPPILSAAPADASFVIPKKVENSETQASIIQITIR